MTAKTPKASQLAEIERLRQSWQARPAELAERDALGGPTPPVLGSHEVIAAYLGGISMSFYFERVLPELDVVRIGGRTLPTFESANRFIDKNLQPAPRSHPLAKDKVGAPKRAGG